MKIEKLSDTQIRCTLNKEDLINRELRISELAYGSDKAKQLFRDMMQQAAYEFGFEADDIPLMIEATPVSSDCLVLVITKVEDPDELDTRFSSFTPYAQQENTSPDEDEGEEEDAYADEILNCFEHLGELLGKREKGNSSEHTPRQKIQKATVDNGSVHNSPVQIPASLTKIFTFESLQELTSVCQIITLIYQGESSLYKNRTNQLYYLIIHLAKNTPENFNKICNIISEYGKNEKTNYASISYYREHFDLLIASDAVTKLASL